MPAMEPYRGPLALAGSRYAPPHRKAEAAAIAAAQHGRNIHQPVLELVKPEAKPITALATQEQIAALPERPKTAGVQLAQIRNDALDNEVKQHTITVARSVSAAVVNSRRIMELVREVIKSERPDSAKQSLAAVEDLWQELEKLAQVTFHSNQAIPHFLEKQKENTSLIAASNINHAYVDTQEELAQQHKKVDIQSGIIAAQEKAFKEHEASINEKLKQVPELQERLTRATLEKGLFRAESEKVQAELVKTKSAQETALENAAKSAKEVAALTKSVESLSGEKKGLQGTIDGLEKQSKAADQKKIENEKELRAIKEQLKQAQQQALTSNNQMKSLRMKHTEVAAELEKAKAENKMALEKAKILSAQHANSFEKFNDQERKSHSLKEELEKSKKENLELKASRARDKEEFKKQYNTLRIECDQARDDATSAKEKVAQADAKLVETKKSVENLAEEKKNLVAKQIEVDSALSTTLQEIDTLKAELKNKTTAVGGSAAVAELKKSLEELQQEFSKSEHERSGWEEVARRAMKKYNEMAPTYNEARAHKQHNDELRQENQRLNGQIAQHARANGTSNGNPGVSASDVAFWKKKYNDLLDSLDR